MKIISKRAYDDVYHYSKDDNLQVEVKGEVIIQENQISA